MDGFISSWAGARSSYDGLVDLREET